MKLLKNKYGFTLIEVLIYTVIFAIVAGLSTGILLILTRINQQQSAGAEVTDQLNFVMQRIQYLVKQSSNIEIPVGVTTSILKLRMEDPNQDPTCLSLIGGVIKLSQGDPVSHQNCTSVTSDLTNSRVVVNTFDFKKFTQYPGHDTVSINIQMTYNSSNPQSQIQRTIQSAIARVSAATFDSNVLPGSTSFTIGQSGSAWQNVFVGDGSASSPSYSFGNNTSLGMFRAGNNILGFSTNGAERIRIDASGNITINSGGLAGHAVCWKAVDGKTLGYCSTAPNASGICTCN